ncbi:MAG TPA: hypothetical protein VK338_01290 [Candidatus Nitrosocosmicus sp.]|nr:hypothetical protein [Candidatus Nitrosocosmicus sp.]
MNPAFFKHIKKEFHKHLFDYLFLLSASVFCIIVLSLLRNDSFSQFIVLTSYVILYLVWSIAHHVKLKDLNFKIVLEYILIAGTALFIIKTLTIK